jgi:hypothetical protein
MGVFLGKFSYNGLTSLDGVMSALEFFDHTHKKEHTGNIREAFNVFDRNGDSWISSEEIYNITTRMGGIHKLTEGEARLLISDFDYKQNGRIPTNEIAYVSNSEMSNLVKVTASLPLLFGANCNIKTILNLNHYFIKNQQE